MDDSHNVTPFRTARHTRAQPVRERDIEHALVLRVKARAGEVRKAAWQGRRGAPDRLVMLPGRSFWVELKAPGKRPTLSQQREHERMRLCGMRVHVIDSLDQVEALLP